MEQTLDQKSISWFKVIFPYVSCVTLSKASNHFQAFVFSRVKWLYPNLPHRIFVRNQWDIICKSSLSNAENNNVIIFHELQEINDALGRIWLMTTESLDIQRQCIWLEKKMIDSSHGWVLCSSKPGATESKILYPPLYCSFFPPNHTFLPSAPPGYGAVWEVEGVKNVALITRAFASNYP